MANKNTRVKIVARSKKNSNNRLNRKSTFNHGVAETRRRASPLDLEGKSCSPRFGMRYILPKGPNIPMFEGY